MNARVFAVFAAILLIIASVCAFAYTGFGNDEKHDDTYDEVVMQFLDICNVPRCSYNNEKIGAYLVDFADRNGLNCEMDETGNVLIDHPGKDTHIIMQGHMDMVAATEEGRIHDWTQDPIETYIENGKIRAVGTSLGADDGMGMAIMLCALKAPEFEGIGFRCIFTVDEEVGFIGANAVSKDWVEGYRYLINIDHDVSEQIVIGSAGGTVVKTVYEPSYEPVDGETYVLTVDGLLGGHSAYDIKGRANAIILALTYMVEIENARIIDIASGKAYNSIPNKATVTFTAPEGTDVFTPLSLVLENAKKEYGDNEPNITMSVAKNETETYEKQWTEKCSKEYINAVVNCPCGLLEESEYGYIASSNIGSIHCSDGICTMECLIRSAGDEKDAYTEEVFRQMNIPGAETTVTTSFDGWLEPFDSKIIEVANTAHRDAFGHDGKITLAHAGLECGTFSALNPGMMCVSVGADIADCHSVSETLDIDSMVKVKNEVYRMILIISEE